MCCYLKRGFYWILFTYFDAISVVLLFVRTHSIREFVLNLTNWKFNYDSRIKPEEGIKTLFENRISEFSLTSKLNDHYLNSTKSHLNGKYDTYHKH